MTEGLLIAIVTTAGLVVVALISNRGRQHAKAARVQVENNHRDEDGNVINLREENDARHTENVSMIAHLTRQLDRVLTWQEHHQVEYEAALARVNDIDERTQPKGTP